MNTGKQIIIDKTIVKAIAWVLNLLVKAAGKVAPKNHDLSRPFTTIAVCKFKGLGSIIQATPLLQTLKAQYPGAKLIFVTSKSNEQILRMINVVDEIIVLDDRNIKNLITGAIPFIAKLFKSRIEVYVDLEVYSNFSSVIAALTNAQNRFGYYLKESNYRMGIYTHMMYYNSSTPIFQTYLQWARLLGCKQIVSSLYKFETGIDQINIDGTALPLLHNGYIVINPNASDLRVERRWPAANYIALIKELQLQYPQLKMLLIGSGGERGYVATIAGAFSDEHVINVAGYTSTEELIGVIQNAKLVITNDTGPMHLAFAMRKNTVALFGPCSPAQYGHPEHTISLYKNVYCSPCVHDFRIPPCLGDNHCMQLISIAEVLLAVHTMYNDAFIPEEDKEGKIYSTAHEPALGRMIRKTY